MCIDPLALRAVAFGARVHEVDGHDVEALAAAALEPPAGRPLLVLAHTDPCRGLPLLQKRAPKLHYVRFVDAAERQAYSDALAALEVA